MLKIPLLLYMYETPRKWLIKLKSLLVVKKLLQGNIDTLPISAVKQIYVIIRSDFEE